MYDIHTNPYPERLEVLCVEPVPGTSGSSVKTHCGRIPGVPVPRSYTYLPGTSVISVSPSPNPNPTPNPKRYVRQSNPYPKLVTILKYTHTRTRNFCEFCKTLIPVHGTSQNGARLPEPYPESEKKLQNIAMHCFIQCLTHTFRSLKNSTHTSHFGDKAFGNRVNRRFLQCPYM